MFDMFTNLRSFLLQASNKETAIKSRPRKNIIFMLQNIELALKNVIFLFVLINKILCVENLNTAKTLALFPAKKYLTSQKYSVLCYKLHLTVHS